MTGTNCATTRNLVSIFEHIHAYTHAVDWTGSEIRRRREARGLTQQQLADSIGGSRRSVIAWERGDAAPQGRFIGQLERVLGGPVDSEAGDEGPLLRDATFPEAVNHLLTLYNRAVRGAGAEHPETGLPDPRHHRLLEGPPVEFNNHGPMGHNDNPGTGTAGGP